jgi:hypothetical protein
MLEGTLSPRVPFSNLRELTPLQRLQVTLLEESMTVIVWFPLHLLQARMKGRDRGPVHRISPFPKQL